MTEEQEYIEFWVGVKNKCDEIQKDYWNLSDMNKKRVDEIRDAIFNSGNIFNLYNILNEQLKQR